MSAPSRRTAVAVWATLFLLPVLFAGVTGIAPPPRDPQAAGMSVLLLWMSTAVVGLGVGMSRLLLPRLGPVPSGPPDVAAFTRTLVAWAVLEGAALFPLVAVTVTGSSLLYLPSVVALAALAIVFPAEERWLRLGLAQPRGPGPDRTVKP
ncbi:MAG: hypothetical protein WCK73_08830 [Deltaproteobacteria bacterium]